MEYINERRRFSFVLMADGVPSPEDRERLAGLAEEMKNKANEFFKGESIIYAPTFYLTSWHVVWE